MIFNSNNRNIYIAILSLAGFLAICTLLIISLEKTLYIITIVFIIAYILNPLIEKFQQKFGIKRWISSLIVSFLTLLLLVLIPALVTPMLITQAKIIITHFPNIITTINQKLINPINAKLGTHFILNIPWLKLHLMQGSNLNKINLNSVVPLALSGLTALSKLIDIVLIPFTLFYIIKDWHKIIAFLDRLIPRRYIMNIHNLIYDIDKSLSYYLRGQLLVMVIMAIIYAIGLNIVGLQAATVIGIITGLLVFIPYVGLGIGTTIALLMTLTQFTGIEQIIKVLIVLGVGNLVENLVITPWCVGDSIGLNPVMIIFALIICGNLFGIIGIIASLPLTAVSIVILKHMHKAYLESRYYKKRSS